MDARFVWKDEYNLGVEILDKEHQRLFKIINKIINIKEKSPQWACQEGVKFFKGHTLKHFDDEEEYMRSIAYEGLEQHKKIHDSFKNHTLPTLEQELEKSEYAQEAVDHFLGVCAGWLIGHTMTEDQAIVGRGMRKWGNLLPGEEIASLKKIIVQLIFDMFQLESHLISDTYGGEKFGKGVYYRLLYTSGEKKREVFLVFEENLLINTVGKILGIQTNRLDAMLVHAARYTARQFDERILEHFADGSSYTLAEESLLTYEQFHRVFEKEQMQASLLFDTGAGYFAHCVIAPHLLNKDGVEAVEIEKDMSEVKKYLAKRRRRNDQPDEEDMGELEAYLVQQKMRKAALKEAIDEETELAELEAYLEKLKARKAAPPAARKEPETAPTRLDTANAAAEVGDYLSRRAEEQSREAAAHKPKVLVVDDSLTIRTSMKELLETDYEVSMVESGVAAIRAITLDRPDLVLLDYEMPVCDGAQTLEMLRSEREFVDLPVIFLTGRSDPDSVRKVMALKPTGYLLKYLKHEDIKRKIDNFFVSAGKR